MYLVLEAVYFKSSFYISVCQTQTRASTGPGTGPETGPGRGIKKNPGLRVLTGPGPQYIRH